MMLTGKIKSPMIRNTPQSMNIKALYGRLRLDVANEQFDKLSEYEAIKPELFNWVEDIFYSLNVRNHPDSKALIWSYNNQERHYTFENIYSEANQFLNFVRTHGIKTGDRVYTQLPVVPANWTSTLAAIKGGLILIPAATTLTVQDIAYRFKTVFPEVAIADLENAVKIDEAEKLFNKTIKVKIIVHGERNGWHSYNTILKEEKEAEAVNTKSDDHLFYFFTSGTTGLPKIVIHTHFTYPVGHLTTATWVGMRHGDIHYNVSAPGWAKFAWSSFFAPWNMGATIYAERADKFDVKAQLRRMEKYGITTFCAPPTVLRMMIQEDLSHYHFKLRQCVAAGEPLNPEIIDKWRKGTGVLIRDGYGQSETTCLAANMPGAAVRYGSMGKATFLYDLLIADEEGNEQPPLEEGYICVKMDGKKANGVFIDYLGEPERKKDVFKHQLYYTGDKAYKDEDGFIWFVGRDDDVIKASDFRIGPFEVESVLIEHESVTEAAVVASPHDVRGNAVKAFIVLSAGAQPCKDLAGELFAFCEKNLAKYKIPRIIEFTNTLPKTISGKIRRVELRSTEATSKLNKENRELEFFHSKY
jgi:acyl-coenzyme A synthetase/AMP-(fatty) acid ligase